MWVTLYTDASWDGRLGVGGWAVWARSEKGRIVRSGKCPSYVQSAANAELAAIYAGIYLVLNTWRECVEGIQVRSDNKEALEAVRYQAPAPRNAVMKVLQDKVRSLLGGRVRIRPRWVKGHRNPKGDVTAWLNDHCDRESKLARKNGADGAPSAVQPKKQRRRKKRKRGVRAALSVPNRATD